MSKPKDPPAKDTNSPVGIDSLKDANKVSAQDPSACTNCNGKGYNTRCYDEVGSADFGGEGYEKRGLIEKVPCKKCQKDPSATLEIVKELYEYGGTMGKDFERLEHCTDFKLHGRTVKSYFPAIASLCLEQAEEIKRLRGALDILKRNVVVAVRRAERGLRTQANPLSDLKAVVEALPPLETLIGMTPLCDRCNEACFKDCSKYCDIVLCQKCSDIPPTLSANSPSL